MFYPFRIIALLLILYGISSTAIAEDFCTGFGPQSPRDISSKVGTNPLLWTKAPAVSIMNLCDIHTHTNAEHKGPGFSVSAGSGEHGGFKCNNSDSLSAAELEDPAGGHGAFNGIKPGDTIEVHWVHTTCNVVPWPTLNSCFSESCGNPQLRVDTQVFLVVNDKSALDFADFSYAGNIVNGRHQVKSLPAGTGDAVTFAGSTTGPSFTQSVCSPFQVTWSVRPQCAKIDISSLNKWVADGNVFNEDHSHGVRQLVTAPELLSKIE